MHPTTLFLVVDAFVARAEVTWRRGRPEVTACTRSERGHGSLSERLDQLLAEQPCRGPAVVFSDEVFLHTLELAPRAVAGLRRRDLDSTLALEAQNFSGQSGELATAWTRLGDDRAFLVAQCPQNELLACQEVFDRGGGTLLALAHPAGLPRRLANVTEGRWLRHEQWGSVRASVRGANGETPRLRVGTSGVTLPGDAPSEWLQLHGGGGDDAVADEGRERRFELHRDDALRIWLSAWAEALAAGRHTLLLAPPEPVGTVHRRWLIAGVLLLAAAVGIYLDRSSMQQQLAMAQSQLVTARQPLDRLQALQADIAAVQRQLAAATDAAAATPLPPGASPWSTSSLGAMLEALAVHRPAGTLLETVELGWRQCRISGFAASSADVDVFGEALCRALSDRNFLVQPTSRERIVVNGAELCSFVLELLPIVAPAQPNPRMAATAQEIDR